MTPTYFPGESTPKRELERDALQTLQGMAVTYSRICKSLATSTQCSALGNELLNTYWHAVFAIERAAHDAIEGTEVYSGK